MKKSKILFISGLSLLLALVLTLWLALYLQGSWLSPQQKSSMQEIVKSGELSRSYKLMPLSQSQTAENWILPQYSFQDQNLSKDWISLKDQVQKEENKSVLILFWASWLNEELVISQLNQLEKLNQKYSSKGISVFSIALDTDMDLFRHQIENIHPKIQISYPILIDTDLSVKKQYQITSFPVYYILDQNGKIRFNYVGSDPFQFDIAEMILDQLMLEQSNS